MIIVLDLGYGAISKETIMKSHLNEVGMGYVKHLLFGLKFAMKTFGLSIILLIHAIVPCLFKTYFSSWIKKCHDRLYPN